jgi:nitrogen fixation protein FixH
VQAVRPADASADLMMVLRESAPGEYLATAPLRESGLWYFEVEIDSGSDKGLVKFQRMLNQERQG